MPIDLAAEEAAIRLGGGAKAIERQHEKGRLTARERIAKLVDPDTDFFELGLWAAWRHVRGVGRRAVGGRRHRRRRRSAAGASMVIANDATVKAGAFFPMTCKKVLRAQRIAIENRLPLVYLVDSAGVFLPLQDEVFPDEDDFGRIFRNNAVISAAGIPQFAAIMGNCVAGGGYLPVLCDTLLMTEGSGLYLAGPALVKAAIGQVVDSRGARRREDARRDQRHHRLPRAERRGVPRATAAAGGRTARGSSPRSPETSPPGCSSPGDSTPFTQPEYDVRDLLEAAPR